MSKHINKKTDAWWSKKEIITEEKHANPSIQTNEINSYTCTCHYCTIRQESVGDGGLTLYNTELISAQKEVGGAESEVQLHKPPLFPLTFSNLYNSCSL